jgi:large conductance mechanosensitive channel
MKMVQEFKEFVNKGSVIDLAVGVIMGTAFGRIVSSAVEDLIMPPIGKLLGNLDFTNFYIPMSSLIPKGLALSEAKKLGPVFAYGNFLTVSLNFVIVSFFIFLVVKAVNRMKRREEAKPSPVAAVPEDLKVLREIRDLLQSRNP